MPLVFRRHLLMGMGRGDARPGPSLPLALAQESDAEEVISLGLRLRREEFGEQAVPSDPGPFGAWIRTRIRQGRTWIARVGSRIAFKIDVGVDGPQGAQFESAFTLPEHRGQGLCSGGLRWLSERILATRPRVTLHVWEANQTALAVYAHVGFAESCPYRVVLR
jgi:predicted GNAT family acetyltransferase